MLLVPPCIGHSTSAGCTKTTRPSNRTAVANSQMRFMRTGSFRPVGAPDIDRTILAGSADPHAPRVAADFAVLNERAADVGFEIDLQLLAAVRTRDGENLQS